MSIKLRKHNEETYEPTGEQRKDHEQKDGLIIHDKTKEFRDIERKISELSQRKTVSLQEKRKIDSTIDEKIDALIEWYKKHPDIRVGQGYKGKPISYKTFEKLKELAQNEGVEFSEIEDRYNKMQSYNRYLRQRERKGKLSDEQKKKCKDGNLGGRFGYQTEIEEIADKLKIDVKQVIDLTTRYGSVANFIQMYRNGNLSIDEYALYNENLINNMIDMDYNPLAKNYSKLIQTCFGEYYAERKLQLFSSNNIDKVLENLKPREMEYIKLRFGLVDGKYKNLADAAQEFGATKERVRQLELNTLRKLRHSNNARLIKTIKIDDLKKSEYITIQERTALTNLENDMFNSNLIFKHESIYDIDFDKDRFDVIRDIQEEIKEREKKEEIKKREKKEEIETRKERKEEENIEKLDFSTRTFNALKRFGIDTINQLASLSEGDLIKIRNLGKHCIKEIISKLEERGIKLNEKPEVEKIDKKTVGIIDIGLSVKSLNCLKYAGIETLADLENLTYEELMKIRKVNQKRLEEIVSKTKKYGITFKSAAELDEPDPVKTTTEEKPDETVYSDSEMEEIKAKRTELKAELKALEEQTRKARELLAEYNKLIGDDKVNTDNEAQDFKDE